MYTNVTIGRVKYDRISNAEIQRHIGIATKIFLIDMKFSLEKREMC